MTQPIDTTIRYWQTDSGDWKATEPDSERDLVGRGATPASAIAHYGELLDDVLFAGEASTADGAKEVPADD